ncbi:MAG: ankyrin repeat domain-containing protein [Novosphingobium sp.]|jgi:ankyrin repeat protein|uniref:ankyrin repeat domain-containing protein n=1 Tax=Novosphingobium sp. TaxID=1874826 RepID=UPI00301693B3
MARSLRAAFAAAALLGTLGAALPAHAQFSESYKFLEAVRKKDGQKVTDALNEPGSQIVNTRDSITGESGLHIVTARRDLTWMQFLVGHGANVNVRDAKGTTPLVLAANLGFLEGVDFLITSGARVDEPNNTGETPLITAVHRRDLAMVRVLLKAGANPDRPDNSGRSARDYAMLEGKDSPVASEIAGAVKGGAQGAKKTYGPSF